MYRVSVFMLVVSLCIRNIDSLLIITLGVSEILAVLIFSISDSKSCVN